VTCCVAPLPVSSIRYGRKGSNTSQLEAPRGGAEILLDKIQGFAPKDDRQNSLEAQATSIVLDLGQTRWLQYAQGSTSISMPLLVVLVFWLHQLRLVCPSFWAPG